MTGDLDALRARLVDLRVKEHGGGLSASEVDEVRAIEALLAEVAATTSGAPTPSGAGGR